MQHVDMHMCMYSQSLAALGALKRSRLCHVLCTKRHVPSTQPLLTRCASQRTNRIIFIGKNLDREALTASLQKCLA